MIDLVSRNPLVHKIVSEEAHSELLDMLLAKQLPFTEEEYLECLVYVMKEEKARTRALDMLNNIPDSVKANYLEKQNANQRVAYYIVLEALNKKNVYTIARGVHNQALPYEFLLKVAEKGDVAMLEILLENQIKLIAYPQIMDMMNANPQITPFIKGKVEEIREFYLRAGQAAEIPLDEVLEGMQQALVDERKATLQVQEASTEEQVEEIPLEKVKEKAQTMLQIINQLSVPERVRMALAGDRTQRAILIKDSNKMVSDAVISSPKITKDEITLIVRDKSIAGDIIARIVLHREWTKDYAIILGLTENPKTPVKNALALIKNLHTRDLRMLSTNKNASPVIRTLAINLFQQRTSPKAQKK